MHLQERGNLQQSQLAAFLTGQLSAEEAVKSSRKAELLCQVQNFLISTQQVRLGFTVQLCIKLSFLCLPITCT
jgi:hypothetical protein